MNATSSRSHSIFAMYLHGVNRELQCAKHSVERCRGGDRFAELPWLQNAARNFREHCIWWTWPALSDWTSSFLSDRLKGLGKRHAPRSGSTGDRLKETQNINKSLSATQHIPKTYHTCHICFVAEVKLGRCFPCKS